jgi:hypothetical protein
MPLQYQKNICREQHLACESSYAGSASAALPKYSPPGHHTFNQEPENVKRFRWLAEQPLLSVYLLIIIFMT